jgi:6-pyruvoyl-tetrahydropterin synthase
MTLVGARAHFCAAHSLPQHPTPHGHSYEVWAYVEGGCAEELQRHLGEVCGGLDHKNLNDLFDAPTMETIAQFIGYGLRARKVVVSRPVEGLCAEWTA